jgi:predicted dienelactone hydrolase
MNPSARRFGSALLVVSLTLAACSTSSGETDTVADTDAAGSTEPDPTAASDTARPSGAPYEYTVSHETLVDDSRPTPAGTQTESLPARTLVTDVYLPDGSGRSPLIVFAHGLTGLPSRHTELLGAWAEAGYVVAAPAFPLTNGDVPGGLGNAADVGEQDDDLRFVIDELVAASDDPDSPYAGRIDTDRIGASGHSLGGVTLYTGMLDACCVDDDIDAAVIFASANGEAFTGSDGIPVLVMHGDTDPVLPYASGQKTYERLGTPRYFVTLLGADHVGPYEDSVSDHDAYVADVTIAFRNHYLAGDGDFDAATLEVPGLTTVVYDEP